MSKTNITIDKETNTIVLHDTDITLSEFVEMCKSLLPDVAFDKINIKVKPIEKYCNTNHHSMEPHFGIPLDKRNSYDDFPTWMGNVEC